MTYLFHYRHSHISWKRMKKLHNDGLLNSFDLELFETCECLVGKMTKTHSNLLEVVHICSDVCLMSVNVRGGYQYFINFTY